MLAPDDNVTYPAMRRQAWSRSKLEDQIVPKTHPNLGLLKKTDSPVIDLEQGRKEKGISIKFIIQTSKANLNTFLLPPA